MHLKDINPKDLIGITKLPLHLVSPIMKAYLSISMYLGATKYGTWNWRGNRTTASVYFAALQRHLDKWWQGEEDDADGTPHLANALACLTIIMEGRYIGNMADDRPPSVSLDPLYKKLEAMMPHIKEKFGDYQPKHFTIADKVHDGGTQEHQDSQD
jgi:dATP/dGTP diphosphohydrolase